MQISDYSLFDSLYTSNFSGYLDYDRDVLANTGPDQRTEWFKVRTVKVIVNPLRKLITEKLVKNDDQRFDYKWDFYLSMALIMLVGIETLAGFRYSNKNKKERDAFQQFMKVYFDPIWQSKIGKRTYALLLYDQYRNAMAHGFYARGFWEAQQKDYIVCKSLILTINIYRFHFDFVEAIKKYFMALDQDAELRRLVDQRVQTLLDEIKIHKHNDQV